MCGGRKRGQEDQSLGRSVRPELTPRGRGGFSSKLHALTDALGNPLEFVLTGGETHDIVQAAMLLDDWQPRSVIADKGYDANSFVETIEQRGATAVIPPRSNRKQLRDYDRHLYKERHLIE